MNPLPPQLPELPSMIALADCPQLAPLTLLQSALRVTGASLDLYHPNMGSVQQVARDAACWPPSLLAQLISDRCRELADLIAAYRITLHPPPAESCDDDDSPF